MGAGSSLPLVAVFLLRCPLIDLSVVSCGSAARHRVLLALLRGRFKMKGKQHGERKGSSMGKLAKPVNRVLFLACVMATGALAGAFVWAFFFLMDAGLGFLWNDGRLALSSWLEQVAPALARGPFGVALFPFLVCVAGGLVIGLYEKKFGVAIEGLNAVMAKVKRSGRYEYDNLGKRSVAALLPLLFGGSIGPEVGLTGVIAGLCTWVGDRLRRFGGDFRAMTMLGCQAALTALFTAPLYGFAAPLSGSADGAGGEEITLPKRQKAFVYACAVTGALAVFLGLGSLFGGGMGMPRFDAAQVSAAEVAWFAPLVVCGVACGWAYHGANKASAVASAKLGDRPVARALVAGAALAICGTVLPFTLFAGESQAHMVMEGYASIGAGALIATAFVKAALTPTCINFGWRGGHFFPVIFSGVCLGYGFALVAGIDAAFCVAVCTAALLGSVMRQPVMVVLLLFLCFPPSGVVAMLAATAIGAAVPLPKALQREA